MSYSTGQDFVELINAISATINEHQDELNKLDAALGDGDHGTGLAAGFRAAAEQSQGLENPLPAEVLQATSMAMMNTMGGSSGALYGTFFLKASITVKSLEHVSRKDWSDLLESGLQGVMQRGKAEPGGKTMVDALHPAVIAYKESIEAGNEITFALESASHAAREGANGTANMVAKYGRAKFTGERALGHQDAGANSIALLFEALVAN